MKKLLAIHERPQFLIIFFLPILLFSASKLSAQQSHKVLFLGNSYTAANNLPQMVQDVAQSAGDTLIFDSNTPGGYTLIGHNNNSTTQSKIMAGGWDYVVMQGQSQEAITNKLNFRDGATNLNQLISQSSPCAVPMFYITWGRKNGDPSNCISYPVMCTYEGMDSTIKNNYLELAASLNAEVSPVSVAWNFLRKNHPSIELYSSDGSHPSAAGSYAAACSFYATIFKRDPLLITFNHSLSATDASIIRNAVKTAVFDNLSLWDFKQAANSEFWYEIGTGTNEVKFHAKYLADTYLWEFGDGTSSSLRDPIHSYATDGTYNVVLTATNCDPQGMETSITDKPIDFCSHTPTVAISNPWLCSVDSLWAQPADSYQWYANNGTGLVSIPETNQYLPDYVKYGNDFAVMTTVGGCAELSRRFFAIPSSSYYHIRTIGVGGGSMADTAYLFIQGLLGGENIQWFKDDIIIPSETNDTLIITTGGSYHFEITNSNCPFDQIFVSSKIGVVGPTSVKNIFQDLYWSISPNPVKEVVTINFEQPIINEQIQVFSATGKLILEMETSGTMQINSSALADGVYFIRLKNHALPALKFIKY